MDQSVKDEMEQNKFDHTIFKDYLKQKFLKLISDVLSIIGILDLRTEDSLYRTMYLWTIESIEYQ